MDIRKLAQIRRLNEIINQKAVEVEELRAAAAFGKHILDPIGGSRASPANHLEQIFVVIDRKERQIDAMIDKRHRLKAEAVREIQAAVPEVAERHILYLRYLSKDNKTGKNLPWAEVIRNVNKYHNIRDSRIYELHHIAVNILKSYNI